MYISKHIPKTYIDWHLHGQVGDWVNIQFLLVGGVTHIAMMRVADMLKLETNFQVFDD